MAPVKKQTIESVAKAILVLAVVTGLSTAPCHAQADSVKDFKNTIRVNLTNPLLFSWKFNVIGYERVIKDYQTASVNIGRTAFGSFLFSSDSLDLTDQFNDRGFNFSLDYRFYLQKENRYRAPRGIYLGPYYSFNHFSRDMAWDLSTDTFDGEVNTGMNINAHFIGAQLGYQFVFWDRLTLDIILAGPGLWFFNLNTTFDTDLSSEDEAMLLEKLNEMLKEKFPESDFMISGEGFEARRTTTTATMGFRYMINLGFRF